MEDVLCPHVKYTHQSGQDVESTIIISVPSFLDMMDGTILLNSTTGIGIDWRYGNLRTVSQQEHHRLLLSLILVGIPVKGPYTIPSWLVSKVEVHFKGKHQNGDCIFTAAIWFSS